MSSSSSNPPSTAFQTSQARWLALSHRNPAAHSSFLYGVKSTKIFCRPTCPARLARRANIVFYNTSTDARRDGFRACKRCQPDNPAFAGEGTEVVTRTIACLVDQMTKPGLQLGLREVAKEVGVTPSYLCRVFKRTMGCTVGEYKREFERGPSRRDEGRPATTASSESVASTPREATATPSDASTPYSITTPSESAHTRGSTPPTPAMMSFASPAPLPDLLFTPDASLDFEKDLDLDWDVAMDLEFSFDDWLYGDDVTHASGDVVDQPQV